MHADGIGTQCAAHHADDAKEDVIRNGEKVREVVADLKTGRTGKEGRRRACSHAADGHAAKTQQGDDQAGHVGGVAGGVLHTKAGRDPVIEFLLPAAGRLACQHGHAHRAHGKPNAGNCAPKAALRHLLPGELLERIGEERQLLLGVGGQPGLIGLVFCKLSPAAGNQGSEQFVDHGADGNAHEDGRKHRGAMSFNGNALQSLDENGKGDDGGNGSPAGRRDICHQHCAHGEDHAGIRRDHISQRREQQRHDDPDGQHEDGSYHGTCRHFTHGHMRHAQTLGNGAALHQGHRHGASGKAGHGGGNGVGALHGHNDAHFPRKQDPCRGTRKDQDDGRRDHGSRFIRSRNNADNGIQESACNRGNDGK